MPQNDEELLIHIKATPVQITCSHFIKKRGYTVSALMRGTAEGLTDMLAEIFVQNPSFKDICQEAITEAEKISSHPTKN